jgi:hypothetical protein
MLGGECRAAQTAIASRPLLMPDRSFLFINVEPPTVLSYFLNIVFMVSAVGGDTADGGKRNV